MTIMAGIKHLQQTVEKTKKVRETGIVFRAFGSENKGGGRAGCESQAVSGQHFFPYHEAESVRPVQIPGIFNLLVLANAIEPHRPGKLDVTPQRSITWRSHQSVRPIATIQHE